MHRRLEGRRYTVDRVRWVIPRMPYLAGEEGLGRYLDLQSHYLAFINAKFGKRDLQYFEYVSGLPTHTASIPGHFKVGTAYRSVGGSCLVFEGWALSPQVHCSS